MACFFSPRKYAEQPALIEPFPPSDEDPVLSSHHEYPDYTQELTPYPFFPAHSPGDYTEESSGLPPLSPAHHYGLGDEKSALQGGTLQDFSPNPRARAKSKSALSRSVTGLATNLIPEESEPDSESEPRRKRGYELGTRPPPVPPKSPLGHSMPKPPPSQVTQVSDNSVALIERHREAIQKVAARKGELASRYGVVDTAVEPWIDKHQPFITEDRQFRVRKHD